MPQTNENITEPPRCNIPQIKVNQNSIVPFRECKFTKVLSEYFTDENNMLMVVNVRLTQKDLEENLKVLKYGALNVHLNLMKSKVHENTLAFQERLRARIAEIKPEQPTTS